MLLCCQIYIPDLPTYLVFYLETTCGSSIDTPPPMTTITTPTHFKSLYILEGYAVLTEEGSDGIIITVSSNGIYDMTLGLSDKKCRELVANRAYNASAITFGEAKEGAMEAYNFLSSASITTIHSRNKMDNVVATTKTLAQSILSIKMGTSKVTDGDNNEDDSSDEAGKSD